MTAERHPATKLIPEIETWNGGRGIDLEDWIMCEGSFPHAIGYSAVFWPRFIEFENYVLLCPFEETALRSFERSSQGHRPSVESVMNHRHMELMFQGENCERSTERMRYLGETLAEIYRVKLAWQFPDREFVVEYDPSSDKLTFFQAEN